MLPGRCGSMREKHTYATHTHSQSDTCILVTNSVGRAQETAPPLSNCWSQWDRQPFEGETPCTGSCHKAACLACCIATWDSRDTSPDCTWWDGFTLHEQRDVTHCGAVADVAAGQHARATPNCHVGANVDICMRTAHNRQHTVNGQ